MAKPIFLIEVDGQMPPEQATSIAKKAQEKITDWHVLVVCTIPHGGKAKFTAFSENTATDIDIEELKTQLLVSTGN